MCEPCFIPALTIWRRFLAVRVSTSGSSLTQTAYERLLHDLLSGKLKPGERLKISELCSVMALNLSAVREALARLTAEGLVTAEPQRGFCAAPISMADLTDITKVRIEIETLAIRRSILLGDIAWESSVLAAFHSMSRTQRLPVNIKPSESASWSAFHSAFHHALCAACDSPWLLRIRDMLFSQSERYRMLSGLITGNNRNIEEEHRSIMEAVLDRDSDRACALIADHFERTTHYLIAANSPTSARGLPKISRRTGAAAASRVSKSPSKRKIKERLSEA